MKNLVRLCVISAVMTTSAQAQTYKAKFDGTVERIGSLGDYESSGAIQAGDKFTIDLSVDTSRYTSSTSSVNGQETAIYAVPIIYNLSFGSFKRSGTYDNFDVVINNDKKYSFFSADGIGLPSIGGYFDDSPFSFSTPTSRFFSTFSVNAYSEDLSILGGVGLRQLLNFDRLNPGTTELSFFSPEAGRSVTAFGRISSGGFTAAGVPEPSTWAFFTLGFGIVGAALRRRRGKSINRLEGAAS